MKYVCSLKSLNPALISLLSPASFTPKVSKNSFLVNHFSKFFESKLYFFIKFKLQFSGLYSVETKFTLTKNITKNEIIFFIIFNYFLKIQ